ncbi:hypothetical protein EDB80DRAFT_716490 [Ilyonectria destructans]|nr:hypothetical protein EDB80DRAFT_716490 [Ilyonectria destructans]
MKLTTDLLPLLLAPGAAAQTTPPKMSRERKSALIGEANAAEKWLKDCEARASYKVEIHTVPYPAHAPKEMTWAMDYLNEHWKTADEGDLPYPGGFDVFMARDGFRVIRMNYEDLPWTVRKYREELLAEGTAIERK